MKRNNNIVTLTEVMSETDKQKPKSYLNFKSPSELAGFNPPEGYMLAGDCHLTRGSITVIGGYAGVGKSRLVYALAIAGATGKEWMGLDVHATFKTLILQVENGEYRLKSETEEILERMPSNVDLDEYVRITTPPTYGFDLNDSDFCEELRENIVEFEPSVIVIDPWNRVVEGGKQEDYRSALDAIMACLPEDSEKKPAVVIVHHLRKPSTNSERKSGRDLLHELAGSYQLGSAARCVFCLEAATNDPEDNQVVLTCCKNNDGKEGAPSAWVRSNGLFDSVSDFDMESFLGGNKSKCSITAEQLGRILGGQKFKNKKEMVTILENEGLGKSSKCYELLKKFNEHIKEGEDGILFWDIAPDFD